MSPYTPSHLMCGAKGQDNSNVFCITGLALCSWFVALWTGVS